jgi:hypothetical protein
MMLSFNLCQHHNKEAEKNSEATAYHLEPFESKINYQESNSSSMSCTFLEMTEKQKN